MSEPTTTAGRALLGDATYEDEGEWIVACYNELLPERILAIEAEARADALDVDRLERAMREHILDTGKGWPHIRGGPMPGDGPQPIDGCDDLCAADIIDRLAAIDALRRDEG